SAGNARDSIDDRRSKWPLPLHLHETKSARPNRGNAPTDLLEGFRYEVGDGRLAVGARDAKNAKSTCRLSVDRFGDASKDALGIRHNPERQVVCACNGESLVASEHSSGTS